MTQMTHPTRRAVTRGLAWSAPALLVVGSAPAFAASTGACTYNYASGNSGTVWNTSTDAPPGGTSTISVPRSSTGSQHTTVTFKATATGGATLDPTYNLSYGNTGTNTVSSSGQIGNDPQTGLVLNLSGTDYETVTVTFGQVVSNLQFNIRDLSWYHQSGSMSATPQEFISFSVPTTVSNVINAGEEATALSASGSVAANTKIYRTATGAPPNQTNHNYYDIKVQIPGPLSSFSFNYGYGPSSAGTTNNAAIISQLTLLTFCAGS